MLADEHGVDWELAGELAALAGHQDFAFDSTGELLLDGEPMGNRIRTPRMSRGASAVAKHPEVRTALLELQRRLGRDGGVILEGRDIGTVVFPDAPVKIYLTARPEVRAARRANDDEAGSKSQGQIAAELAARDHADSTRATSPLRPADDAVIIDTSDLGIDEVVSVILEVVDRVEWRRHRPM